MAATSASASSWGWRHGVATFNRFLLDGKTSSTAAAPTTPTETATGTAGPSGPLEMSKQPATAQGTAAGQLAKAPALLVMAGLQ